MTDYSRAWGLEAIADMLDAVDKVSKSAFAYAIKGDSERAERLNKIGTELNYLITETESIVE